MTDELHEFSQLEFEKFASKNPRSSSSPVNLAPVADVMQINASLLYVKFVKHTVITNAQFEFRTVTEPCVRISSQAQAHFIHLALHVDANGWRQSVECFGENGGPD